VGELAEMKNKKRRGKNHGTCRPYYIGIISSIQKGIMDRRAAKK